MPSTAATPSGVAIFGRVKNSLALQVAAEGLEPTGDGESYSIWLAASPQKMLPLASTEVGEDGRIGAQVEVPTEVLAYLANGTFGQIAITRTDDSQLKASLATATKEKQAPAYTGDEVLRGDDRPARSSAPPPASKNRKKRRDRRLAGQQLAGVHDPGRVESFLHRPQRSSAGLPHLGLHVGGVVAADRVVVGDRAAVGDDRLAGGALDRRPLLDLGAAAGAGDEGEVERGAVGVGVREVAEDEARRALRRRGRRGSRRRPPRAARRSGSRCARSRASRPSPPSPSACRAGRGPGSGRAPRSGPAAWPR